MKKKAMLLLILAVALALVVGLTACTPPDTYQGTGTVSIGSVEDLKAIADKLGSDWRDITFQLTADLDLTDADWTPIGTNEVNSFRSTFDGNGHTITYRINQESRDALAEDETRAQKSSVGLFGFMSGATIKNLTLNAQITVNVNAETGYIGALAGFSMGGVTVEDVTVQTAIVARTVGRYGSYALNDNGVLLNPTPADDQVLYLGGAIGYITGGAKMTRVSVNVNADVQKTKTINSYEENDPSRNFLVRELNLGGIAGFVRPTTADAAETSDVATFSSILATGSITAYASRANVGGLFGYVQKGSVTGGVSSVSQRVYTRYRMNAGGAVGRAGDMTFSRIKSTATDGTSPLSLVYWKMGVDDASNMARNAGGLIGYLDGGKVEESISAATIQAYGGLNYAGGLGAIIKDATAKNIAVSGSAHKVAEGINGAYRLSWSHSDRFGGIAGRVHGNALLEDIDADVDTLFGAVAESLSGVEVDAGDDDKVQKDEVKQIVPVIKDSVTYLTDNAATRMPTTEGDLLEDVYGTAVADDTRYQTRYQAISALFAN